MVFSVTESLHSISVRVTAAPDVGGRGTAFGSVEFTVGIRLDFRADLEQGLQQVELVGGVRVKRCSAMSPWC